MAESHAAADGKLKVFISYSRKDASAFTDELVGGLELAGFSPFLDRHDIVPGEPWEERIGGLILEGTSNNSGSSVEFAGATLRRPFCS
jgi:hypothetical protein